MWSLHHGPKTILFTASNIANTNLKFDVPCLHCAWSEGETTENPVPPFAFATHLLYSFAHILPPFDHIFPSHFRTNPVPPSLLFPPRPEVCLKNFLPNHDSIFWHWHVPQRKFIFLSTICLSVLELMKIKTTSPSTYTTKFNWKWNQEN